MQHFLEVFILLTIAAALIFGFTAFFRKSRSPRQKSYKIFDEFTADDIVEVGDAGKSGGKKAGGANAAANKAGAGNSGAARKRPCPVCSTMLVKGENVSSTAYPSLNGQERLMHIRGCRYCLDGKRERVCPSCKSVMGIEDILICRLFERPGKSIHVHVLGCSICRSPNSGFV